MTNLHPLEIRSSAEREANLFARLPAARTVLKAAALTYVAAALVTLLDVTRLLRVLRF